MLLAKNFISHDVYLKARAEGVHIFLFNEIDFIPPDEEHSGVRFFNCNTQRVESTWYTWKKNDELIVSFKQKFPQFFTLLGYDTTLAIQKAMFWSNFKTGFLWYSLKEFFPNEKIYFIEPMHQTNAIGVMLRYIKMLFKSSNSIKHPVWSEQTYRYAIHIKNNFQLGLYQDIIRKVENNAEYKVFTDQRVDKNYMEMFGFSQKNNIPLSNKTLPLPVLNPAILSKSEWYLLNIILMNWKEMNESLETALQIAHKNLKVSLINEAENGIYGAIVSEVLTRNGVRVYNTMNGIKAGEAQDAYINFSNWFVWDEQMKQLLMHENKIAEEKLIVSGHMVEDLVKNYRYRNSLNLDPESLKNKKVISLFSVKGKRYVKLETINYLLDLLKEDDSYFLMIRPHPSEKPEDYILPDSDSKNVYFVHYNAKTLNDTLHDQLVLSDLAIVFGSTVALDSKWMGVPCITYEVKDKSLIYCTDQEQIIHVRTIEELENCVRKYSGKKQAIVQKQSLPVSDFILNEIVKN